MKRWSSRFEYLLAAIGTAVGLGKIWQFPAVMGKTKAVRISFLVASGVGAGLQFSGFTMTPWPFLAFVGSTTITGGFAQIALAFVLLLGVLVLGWDLMRHRLVSRSRVRK